MANAWSKNQQQFAYYVIATVESGCNYLSVNLNDCITLGIGQWAGTNAVDLLLRVQAGAPEEYAKITEKLRNDVETYKDSDWGFWGSYYLSNADGESWQAIGGSEPVKKIQDEKMLDYLFGEGNSFDTLLSWGCNGDNVKNMILLLSAIHQSPLECGHVIQNVGGDREYHETLNAILNNGILGIYSNRYNEVVALLDGWDGESAPPDFGQSDAGLPTNPDTDGQKRSSVEYIEMINGQDLVVHGAMGTGKQLICYYNGNNTWSPGRNASAPKYPGTGSGGIPGSPDAFPAMKKIWEDYAGAFGYQQAPGRLNPIASGFSDCSACIWWAANLATDNYYDWLGDSTFTMLTTCREVYSSDDGYVPLDVLQPGDLILMEYPVGQHVDWYWGDGVVWGAPGAPLPHHITDDVTSYYLNKVYWLKVHRFMEDIKK